MPLVAAKCTQCGVNLQVDSTKDAVMCEFCGTPFITEKAINRYNTVNNINAQTVNVFGNIPTDFIIRAGTLEKYNGAATDVIIPDNIVRIGTKAFFDCVGLKSVIIPDSVTTINEYAFCNCIGLTSITIPNSVTYIEDYSFKGCSNLSHIILPNSVIEIGNYAFLGCKIL